jgi:hypothetical protein
MKRYLFILLLIVSIGLLVAVESDPSATVGYFKKSVASNSWDVISLPFNYTYTSVDSIFGNQFAQDDIVQDVYTGTNTTYYEGWGWFGDLTDLSTGAAYWVNRAEANAGFDYFIMGTVNPQAVTVTVNPNGWSCFSLNEAAPVLIENLPIIDAIQDDVIQDIYTGTNTTYYEGWGWFGDLLQIDPTHAYWYNTANLTGFSWTYPPARNGARDTVTAPTRSRTTQPQTLRTKK